MPKFVAILTALPSLITLIKETVLSVLVRNRRRRASKSVRPSVKKNEAVKTRTSSTRR